MRKDKTFENTKIQLGIKNIELQKTVGDKKVNVEAFRPPFLM